MGTQLQRQRSEAAVCSRQSLQVGLHGVCAPIISGKQQGRGSSHEHLIFDAS